MEVLASPTFALPGAPRHPHAQRLGPTSSHAAPASTRSISSPYPAPKNPTRPRPTLAPLPRATSLSIPIPPPRAFPMPVPRASPVHPYDPADLLFDMSPPAYPSSHSHASPDDLDVGAGGGYFSFGMGATLAKNAAAAAGVAGGSRFGLVGGAPRDGRKEADKDAMRKQSEPFLYAFPMPSSRAPSPPTPVPSATAALKTSRTHARRALHHESIGLSSGPLAHSSRAPTPSPPFGELSLAPLTLSSPYADEAARQSLPSPSPSCSPSPSPAADLLTRAFRHPASGASTSTSLSPSPSPSPSPSHGSCVAGRKAMWGATRLEPAAAPAPVRVADVRRDGGRELAMEAEAEADWERAEVRRGRRRQPRNFAHGIARGS